MTDPSSQHDPAFGGGDVIDADTVLALKELGGEAEPGLFLELVDLYLQDASERVQSLMAAWGSGDLEAVARCAHALKAASANVGAITFSGSCNDLENAARSGAGEALGEFVARCGGMFGEVEAKLRALRDQS